MHDPEHSTAALDELFSTLWRQYVAITPDADSIHQLLSERGERIVNDHIALRTFGSERVGIEVMARSFLRQG